MSRRASGLRAWILQRITAVYLAAFIVLFGGALLLCPPASYAAWRDWLASPWISIALLLFFLALMIHAWVGVRDILIDYVHPLPARIALLSLTGIGLIGCGFWAAQVIILSRLAA
jgi:succinate dehydrogenase / fumarate reductase membrane anchor subunit